MTIEEIEIVLTQLLEQVSENAKNIAALATALSAKASNDDLNHLADTINDLLTDNQTLSESVAELNTSIKKIDNLSSLIDVQINDLTAPLTNGDILLYGNDGKWHNIQPSQLNLEGGSSVGVSSLAELSDVIISTVSNGLALVYDGLHGAWVNKNVSGGGSSDMSGYLTTADAEAIYFPKRGGTITGNVTINKLLLVKDMFTCEEDILSYGGVTMHGG